MVIVSIDVSKDKLDIAILPSKEHIVIQNDDRAIRRWVKDITKRHMVELVVFEATGGYEKRLLKTLESFAVPMHVAHPNQVHHFAQSRKVFAKTDKMSLSFCYSRIYEI